jgi:hypothetical protein
MSFLQIYPEYEQVYRQSFIIKYEEIFNEDLVIRIQEYCKLNNDKHVIMYCKSNEEYVKNISKLPNCVTKLIIVGQYNTKFNDNITIFPRNLSQLELLILYAGSLDYLPESLEYLRLCMWYPNQKLDNLPCNLKKIYIENYFTTDFNQLFTILPKSLEYLELMEIQNITWSYLPPNIKSIILDKQYILEFQRSESSKIEKIKLLDEKNNKEYNINLSNDIVNYTYQIITRDDATNIEIKDSIIIIYLNID